MHWKAQAFSVHVVFFLVSQFQVTGMIEGFFGAWNFQFRDFFGHENLASILLGSFIWVGIFWGY